MITQQCSLAILLPLALEQLGQNPFAEGDFYAGDLLLAVLRLPHDFWQDYPVWQQQLGGIISSAMANLETLPAYERPMIATELRAAWERWTVK